MFQEEPGRREGPRGDAVSGEEITSGLEPQSPHDPNLILYVLLTNTGVTSSATVTSTNSGVVAPDGN